MEQPDHRDREQQHGQEDEHLVQQELREAAPDDAQPRPGTGHGAHDLGPGGRARAERSGYALAPQRFTGA